MPEIPQKHKLHFTHPLISCTKHGALRVTDSQDALGRPFTPESLWHPLDRGSPEFAVTLSTWYLLGIQSTVNGHQYFQEISKKQQILNCYLTANDMPITLMISTGPLPHIV